MKIKHFPSTILVLTLLLTCVGFVSPAPLSPTPPLSVFVEPGVIESPEQIIQKLIDNRVHVPPRKMG